MANGTVYCNPKKSAAPARSTIQEAADLLSEMGRMCSTQGGQLLKDAARDAVKMSARLRALDENSAPRPTLEQFIAALDAHGWRGLADAQHERIAELHAHLYPA